MYGKLFVSMYDGSIYGNWEAIVTFQQLIILADKDGIVEMTPQALSARTSIPIEIITKGLEVLETPDSCSRTPDEKGRRIVRVEPGRPWGWHITNYAKYRAIRTAEERRGYHRQYWHKRKIKNQPDSTGTQQNQPIVEAEVKVEVKNNTSEISQGNSTRTQVPFQKIVNLYHEVLPELPKVEVLTDARKGHIRQRWLNELPTLEHWTNYFNHVKQSGFLMGKVEGKNRRPFRASLEWLTKPGNFAKVAEDNYHG